MPARLLPLLTVLSAGLLSAGLLSAAAQPVPAQAPVQIASAWAPVAADRYTPALDVYAGRYATDGGEVEVTVRAGRLAVVAHGAPVAAALADRPASAEARLVLDAWVDGDLAPALAALTPADREQAAVDFGAAFRALTAAWGDARSAEPVGTFRRTDGRRVTLARVAFERGSEWLSLVWSEDGELSTITRGLGAADLGAARPSGRDAFVLGDATLRFDRDAEGRVSGLRVQGGLRATR